MNKNIVAPNQGDMNICREKIARKFYRFNRTAEKYLIVRISTQLVWYNYSSNKREEAKSNGQIKSVTEKSRAN